MVYVKYLKHYRTKYQLTPNGIHWSHATKSGGAVLREDVGWRNINGVWIGIPRHRWFILFRRAM